VFCCFNASYKILPEIFAVWMELLRKVEGSILWLAGSNPAAQANLRRECARAGVKAGRLVFATHLPSFADHLRRIAVADLFLDTLPFNAHSTAIDALTAGIPFVTCAGKTMAGRAGASLLLALGLPELVAESLDAYTRIAVTLAQDRDTLSAVRRRIAHAQAGRSDMKVFTQKLERALSAMHDRHTKGQPPASFSAASDA
jgi:predicted O-linked N-acetylglucosamine transferase (SPINDLY family)